MVLIILLIINKFLSFFSFRTLDFEITMHDKFLMTFHSL